jgi:putative transposase
VRYCDDDWLSQGESAVRINRDLDRVTGTLFGRNFWSRGYCVSTVDLDEQKIRKCIQEQEKREMDEMTN